jgi:hypothetical protein
MYKTKAEKQAYDKAYYKKKGDEKRAKGREYYAKNKTAVLERNKAYAASHPETVKAITASYRSRTPEIRRNGTLRRKYNITIDDYAAMFAVQSGVCKICGAEPPTGKHLHVDHDHSNGRVRALLCTDCNLMLGLAHDDTARLRKAIAYLEEHS